jgi:hypothetical protein
LLLLEADVERGLARAALALRSLLAFDDGARSRDARAPVEALGVGLTGDQPVAVVVVHVAGEVAHLRTVPAARAAVVAVAGHERGACGVAGTMGERTRHAAVAVAVPTVSTEALGRAVAGLRAATVQAALAVGDLAELVGEGPAEALGLADDEAAVLAGQAFEVVRTGLLLRGADAIDALLGLGAVGLDQTFDTHAVGRVARLGREAGHRGAGRADAARAGLGAVAEVLVDAFVVRGAIDASAVRRVADLIRAVLRRALAAEGGIACVDRAWIRVVAVEQRARYASPIGAGLGAVAEVLVDAFVVRGADQDLGLDAEGTGVRIRAIPCDGVARVVLALAAEGVDVDAVLVAVLDDHAFADAVQAVLVGAGGKLGGQAPVGGADALDAGLAGVATGELVGDVLVAADPVAADLVGADVVVIALDEDAGRAHALEASLLAGAGVAVVADVDDLGHAVSRAVAGLLLGAGIGVEALGALGEVLHHARAVDARLVGCAGIVVRADHGVAEAEALETGVVGRAGVAVVAEAVQVGDLAEAFDTAVRRALRGLGAIARDQALRDRVADALLDAGTVHLALGIRGAQLGELGRPPHVAVRRRMAEDRAVEGLAVERGVEPLGAHDAVGRGALADRRLDHLLAGESRAIGLAELEPEAVVVTASAVEGVVRRAGVALAHLATAEVLLCDLVEAVGVTRDHRALARLVGVAGPGDLRGVEHGRGLERRIDLRRLAGSDRGMQGAVVGGAAGDEAGRNQQSERQDGAKGRRAHVGSP